MTGETSNHAPTGAASKAASEPWHFASRTVAEDSERVYQAWHGTTEPWGGCADAASVGRVLDLLTPAGATRPATRLQHTSQDVGSVTIRYDLDVVDIAGGMEGPPETYLMVTSGEITASTLSRDNLDAVIADNDLGDQLQHHLQGAADVVLERLIDPTVLSTLRAADAQHWAPLSEDPHGQPGTPGWVTEISERVDAATGEGWHWAGDMGEPYLATWIPGSGRHVVLEIGMEERSSTGRDADGVRSNAREFNLGDPEELVAMWTVDGLGHRMSDPRLRFNENGILVNARDRAVFAVAPGRDPVASRADVVGIGHPDADLIVNAPADLRRLLALVAEQAAAFENLTLTREADLRYQRALEDALGSVHVVATDLERAHPNPAPLSVEALAIDRLRAALPAQHRPTTRTQNGA